MKLKLPEEVNEILNIIHENNFEAYVVGGFIRDLLLKKESFDIDITTDAKPQELINVLKKYKINDKYSMYGCLKMKINRYHIEITTYRKEFDYINHRKPTKIEFVNSLKEDLKRRDFTINALCYDGIKFIDEYKGVDDLNNKIIKTIGNPYIRIEEDCLRILRALRFSSCLSFQIDEELKKAIFKYGYLLKTLNKDVFERELKGIKSGENYINILEEYKEILE